MYNHSDHVSSNAAVIGCQVEKILPSVHMASNINPCSTMDTSEAPDSLRPVVTPVLSPFVPSPHLARDTPSDRRGSPVALAEDGGVDEPLISSWQYHAKTTDGARNDTVSFFKHTSALKRLHTEHVALNRPVQSCRRGASWASSRMTCREFSWLTARTANEFENETRALDDQM